ncbi:MAG TPA: hypothetical protein VFI75_03730 [Candidatus Acidoferrum sp.]|nr:hypothetical protein [Candidatus Acidoferrum sp.]
MKSFGKMSKCLAFCLALCLCAPLIAQPYYARLDSETIREAFEFGRHSDEPVGIFLSKYVRTFPTPPKGPYIGWIEVRTPYAQVVYAGKDNMSTQSEFDAVQKFDGAKLPVIVIVRVYRPTTNQLEPMQDSQKDTWKQFPITVSQGRPLVVSEKRLIAYHAAKGFARYTDLQLDFSAEQVSSGMLTVVASSPDGQHVEAKFDLSKLK